ncbi:hypothetical protein KY290_009773 [Solanum tuberosum]|uniref:Uncharacterized protein n=1 Tax=Solanum tuberosum TaxID=4113 RepID=A0ABQ7VX57_SOLTU|nr:hypothetical protein KY289_010148 [Solanum tuberosum]KAH0772636.1 hypothetical protein KY290_009773 [Solanum tuberosum]
MDKQDTDVIDMKQQTLEDVHTGDMVASIEEIKELDSEQAVPGAIYAMETFMEKVLRKMYGKLKSLINHQPY